MKKQEKNLQDQNGMVNKETVDNGLEAPEEDIIPKEMDEVLNSIPDKAQAQVVRTMLSMQFIFLNIFKIQAVQCMNHIKKCMRIKFLKVLWFWLLVQCLLLLLYY